MIRGLGTPVEANPQDTASTNLSKIKIDGTAYNVVGTEVEANPSGTATTDLTKLNVDGTIYSIPEGGTEVEANPAGAATATLGKLGVDDTIYSIPVGSTVVANPSSGTAVGTLTRLDVDGDIYNIDTGSGGSEVEGNPSGAATVVLHKLGIDGTIYSVDGSGSEVEPNPAGEATDVLNKLGVDGTIYSVGGGASTLSGLSDVNIESPTDGQVLSYDYANNEWVNSDPTGNVDDVQVNGTSVLDSNKIAQITSYREVTQAEYDALPASKESDGVLYCIKDKATADTTVAPIIYSEEEREVGVYTDGRPLYQKTIALSKTLSSGNNVYDIGLSDFTIIHASGYLASTTGQYLDMFAHINTVGTLSYSIACWFSDGNKLYISCGSSMTGSYTGVVTLQYTKTTDTPGSGKYAPSGVPAVHYSTSEQVVGTWVDGSTVYEKTYVGTINNYDSSIDGYLISTDIDVTTIKELINIDGSLRSIDSTPAFASLNGLKNTPTWSADIHINQYGILLWTGNSSYGSKFAGGKAVVTIRYTKQTS